MKVAEKTATPTLPQIFSRVRFIPPATVMGMPTVLVLPMPTEMVDLLINLYLAVLITVLMASMCVLQLVNFSVFPSLFLLTALHLLALKVASTCRIPALSRSTCGHGVKEDVRPVGRNRITGLVFNQY